VNRTLLESLVELERAIHQRLDGRHVGHKGRSALSD